MPRSLDPLDLAIQIPHHFRCPISLELMRDPVTVCTGQTYDRTSIESWVSSTGNNNNNTTCPVTRAPLSDSTLIPNHTLRRLIQEWCVANRSNGVERIPTPKQPADPTSVRALLSQASATSGAHVSIRSRAAALRRLRAFARDSEKNRVLIAGSNGKETLIKILFSDVAHDSHELVFESLALLVMFPMTEPDQRVSIISDPGRVGFLTPLLFDSSIETRVNAAALLEMTLTGSKVTVLTSECIFEGVIDLLRNPTVTSHARRALKIGTKALFALCLAKTTRGIAVSSGAPEILIDRLAAGLDRCDAEQALATVELLCRTPEGCTAFGEHALTVPLLVKTILRVSDRATEYAAGALLAVCAAEERWREEAVAAGAVVRLLLMVQSECTERGKRKGQKLLKLLRDSWPDYSFANSDEFGCTEVVPF